jgi:copper transport protein
MRLQTSLLFASLFALLALFVTGQGLYAHALLVRSQPMAGAELAAAPATIELWFSEPLEAAFSTAHLVDSSGVTLEGSTVILDAANPMHMTLHLSPPPPGVYTVVYRTLSQADGHEWLGSFPLTILNADGSRPTHTLPPNPAEGSDMERGELPTLRQVVNRWLSLLGAMLILGSLAFHLLVGRPVTAQASTMLPMRLVAAINRSVRLGLLAGLITLLLGDWLRLTTQLLTLDEAGVWFTLLWRTRGGNLLLVRQLLAGLTFIGAVIAMRNRGFIRYQQERGGAEAPTPTNLLSATPHASTVKDALEQDGIQHDPWKTNLAWLLLAFSMGILITFSSGSHAAAVVGSGWAILGDFVHLAAAGLWLGGVGVLGQVLWQMRSEPSEEEAKVLRGLVRRFSALATLAVFVLICSGLFSTLVQLYSPTLLWASSYGRLLLVKLLLVGLTLAIALLNHRLVRGPAAVTWPQHSYSAFLRQMGGESLLGLLLMVVVAMLVQTAIPQPASVLPVVTPGYVEQILSAEDLTIHLQIAPNQVGDNRYITHLYHADGLSIGEVQLVRLTFAHQSGELGQSTLELTAQGGGLFTATGAYQNRAGLWDVSVYVRRRGLDDLLTQTTVAVPPPGLNPSGDRQPWQNPLPRFAAADVVTVLMITLVVAGVLWRQIGKVG